ncbi:aminoglycoside phosphotransferase family protein [Bacillus pseudomycoides]|uniref:aminoglycoside phosphotransferase family protein n=1 Tax=Bacillus pseudomycoides TaxID=64104 RepID=UPI000BEE57E4|nr:aminoglycoside phosphotransferase family protein [Bacillus pseudomycoides]PED05514.1 aminoglycoside phosphotransferase [Bacillus pseudomycoides]PEI96928.1 aminoglycoside phosphotransferase [Bacillus pseudomycoides]PEK23545.1 aminoglycoside phosphotransferase [Bacillus pseudomycoides]PEM64343.1 aminoglycoside phosphotransferase [Bacillus pseudomycoides]PEO22768.1 aminoglycoside phosphotransferase [Bacillus pseudomycoides]
MNEVLMELEKQLDWPRIVKCTAIPKGFSLDQKYKIELANNERYFIKVCDISNRERKLEEYEYMSRFELLEVPMPKLFYFIDLVKLNQCVQVFEWIEGEDWKDILGKLTEKEQYLAGKRAGEALKTIHTVKKKNVEESWETARWNKYERYLQALEEYKTDFIDLKSVLLFVENHKNLLQGRPIVFLHDDFHPANLMLHRKEFRAVIDFARLDFGDPIHDFYKMALFTTDISVAFAVGQVHGYCDGEPPLHFWKLYALYAAMIFPADIVWTNRITPNLVDEMKMRLRRILEEHNNFTSYIPNWYKSTNKDIMNVE